MFNRIIRIINITYLIVAVGSIIYGHIANANTHDQMLGTMAAIVFWIFFGLVLLAIQYLIRKLRS